MVTETFSYFYFLNLAPWISVKHYIELVRNQTSRKKHRHVHILKTCLFSNFTDVWYCLVNKDHMWTKVNFSSKRQSQNRWMTAFWWKSPAPTNGGSQNPYSGLCILLGSQLLENGELCLIHPHVPSPLHCT